MNTGEDFKIGIHRFRIVAIGPQLVAAENMESEPFSTIHWFPYQTVREALEVPKPLQYRPIKGDLVKDEYYMVKSVTESNVYVKCRYQGYSNSITGHLMTTENGFSFYSNQNFIYYTELMST
jgi:hypothetical protein